MSFRNVRKNDHQQIVKLLKQLTTCDYDQRLFDQYIDNLPDNQYHFVYENDGIILASGVIVIESKIIHNFKKVGHIEDLVVSSEFRGLGIGKKFLNYLITFGKNKNCYKIILNCNRKLKSFYESCQFKHSSIQMSVYF